jgi:hypothetical protein
MMGLQQDARNIYLVMELLHQGDLLKVLSSVRKMSH